MARPPGRPRLAESPLTNSERVSRHRRKRTDELRRLRHFVAWVTASCRDPDTVEMARALLGSVNGFRERN